MAKSIAKQTLREFLKEKGIFLHQIKSVSTKTMKNISRWKNDWQHNKNYRWQKEYFPTERTISKLSLELDITYEQLVTLIKNQFKFNKKLEKNKN